METRRQDPELEALLAQRDFVRGLAQRLLVDEHRAEDLAQSALAVALTRPPREGGARAYLAGVLRRLARKERRAQVRRARREVRGARPERTPPTDAIVAREEWRRRVVERVLALEPRQREVVLLRYFEGLPPRRIARVLGLPVETVKTRLKRALAALRPRLAQGREREELLGGLALLAWPRRGVLPATTLGAGALVMSHASKAALFAFVVLVAGFLWYGTRQLGSAGSLAESDELARAADPASAPRAPVERVASEHLPEGRVAISERARVEARDAERPAVLGRVVSKEDAAPLAGVDLALELEGLEEPVLLATDVDGRFELALATPTRLVAAHVATGERHAARTETLALDLEPGGARELVLRVPRGLRVLGLVLDVEDRPVPGAEVLGWCAREADGEPARRAPADAEGRFVLDHLGEELRVEARAPGFLPANAIVGQSGALEATEELVLRLARPAELRVVVRDAEGGPIAGARVGARPRGPDRSGGLTRSEDVYLAAPDALAREGETDARGELVLDGLAAVEHALTVRREGFVPAKPTARPGGDALEVVLSRGQCVHGIVLAADGRPAVGAEVLLRAFDVLGEARTDAAGRFEILGVKLGYPTPWLSVRAEGHAAFVHEPVREKDCPLRLQLEPARAIAGVLRDLAGEPARGVAIRIEGERLVDGDVTRSLASFPTWESLVLGLTEARTGEDGRFRFEGLYEGSFELSVVREHDGLDRRLAWRVRGGEEALELVLDPTRFDDLVLEGHVRDALTGEPVREFRVNVIAQKEGILGNAGTFNSEPREFRSEEGRFVLGGLAPMPAGIFVSAPGYRDRSVRPEPRAAGKHTIDVDLHPVRSVEVRLVDGRGGAVAGANLLVYDAAGERMWLPVTGGGMAPTVGTDSEGEAILQNLPAGRVRIDVYPSVELRARLPETAPRYESFELDLTAPLEEVQVLELAELDAPR